MNKRNPVRVPFFYVKIKYAQGELAFKSLVQVVI